MNDPADPNKTLKDASRGERLQRVLADAGVASRRACEELILEGAVEVNGVVVSSLPAWADPAADDIRVHGRRIRGAAEHAYVMLYKPRQTLSTLDDPEGRRTVADLVEHPSGARLFPVGRLDFDTMGLLLMTNDGELSQKLTHPRYGVRKTYRAIVKGQLTPEIERKLTDEGIYLADRRDGRTIGGQKAAAVHIEVVNREPTRTHLNIILKEGKNRQVRRMLAAVNCPVRKLVRIKMGPLSLKGLRLGEWRDLTMTERQALRTAADRAASRTRRKAS